MSGWSGAVPPPPASGISKDNLFFPPKCDGEIMNVETVTCAENWID